MTSGVDLIRITRDGDDHAYLGFWSEGGAFSRWYVTWERHYHRNSIGIDFVDHFLDIVIEGNLTGAGETRMNSPLRPSSH